MQVAHADCESAVELFDMLMLRVGAMATLHFLTLCLSTYGVCKLQHFFSLHVDVMGASVGMYFSSKRLGG